MEVYNIQGAAKMLPFGRNHKEGSKDIDGKGKRDRSKPNKYIGEGKEKKKDPHELSLIVRNMEYLMVLSCESVVS